MNFRYIIIASLLFLLPETFQTQELKVILLGTGAGPVVRLQRYGPATLVEAGNEKLLFDCGRGAMLRLTEIGIPVSEVYKLFLTHLHSDHIVDIPDLYLTPWASTDPRKVPFNVWGPAGTKSMMNHIQQAFKFDIHIRGDVDEKFPKEGITVNSHDIGEGIVFEENGVKVTAFNVDHGPVKPALGYRIDYAGHSVVISGDTRPSENLIKFSKGVDVLIHEVMDTVEFKKRASQLTSKQIHSIIAHHTMPEQAGEIFNRVKPRMAVYSHTSGSELLLVKTKKIYNGPLVIGEDLMTIIIGDSVVVKRFSRAFP